MAEPALRMRGVRKTYGRRPVLQAIDVEVAAGETVALLGANGSGKTTLLRVAATLARPDTGDVAVAGANALKEPEQARARLSVLTQEAPLYPELTATEHLRWWARAQGLPSPGTGRILAEAGLARAADQPARSLSRGTRQRLALCMALLPDRPLLVLDEPFTALDDEGTHWLQEELRERSRRGQAVLLSAHGAAEAQQVARRLVRLRDGALEAR